MRQRACRGMNLAIGLVAVIVISAAGTTWALTTLEKHTDTQAAEVPFSASTPHDLGSDLNLLAERLEERLRREPDDAQGWALLARTQLERQRYTVAVQAYSRAIILLPNEVDLQVEYAEAEFLAHARQWTKAAIAATDAALALKSDHPEALWLAGHQRYATKDYAAAVRAWEKLLKVAPVNFDHARELATRLVEARALRDGKDPTAARAAAGVGTRRLSAVERSSASQVVIVARISRTGDAHAQTGDFEGVSPAIAIGAEGVSVLINKPL